jgi:hypothetical protein
MLSLDQRRKVSPPKSVFAKFFAGFGGETFSRGTRKVGKGPRVQNAAPWGKQEDLGKGAIFLAT